MGIRSPVRTRTPTYYLDFTVKPGADIFTQDVPENWTTFAYTFEGTFKFGPEGKKVGPHHTVVFEKGQSGVTFENEGQTEARMVLIAGEPIGEPIVQHGPFVMNTKKEIDEAMQDYYLFRNGFESAEFWESKEGNK